MFIFLNLTLMFYCSVLSSTLRKKQKTLSHQGSTAFWLNETAVSIAKILENLITVKKTNPDGTISHRAEHTPVHYEPWSLTKVTRVADIFPMFFLPIAYPVISITFGFGVSLSGF